MKKIIKKIIILLVISIPFQSLIFAQDRNDSTEYRKIADYVKTRIPDVKMDNITLWTTASALDKTHIAKDLILSESKEITFPFDKSWLVMIDDNPDANFGHPVRWVFIKSDFSQHSEIYKKDFPPLVLSDLGKGKSIEFKCIGITSRACEKISEFHPRLPVAINDHSCKYAVLVSGGINAGSNYSRYPQNLKSMYTMLRKASFAKSRIFVYYAGGTTPIDCDNLDNDNNDATGSDLTGGAIESLIRAKIQSLCSTSDINSDILFTYFTNHGSDNNGACLWDVTGNGLGSDELYSPAELAADVANCKVLKHFMIHDQCYAGEFLPMATDGNHNNLVVYAAANASEPSWGRQYMARWEQNDILTTTLNAMHQDVVTNGGLSSTAAMAEGTAGLGNYKIGQKCGLILKPWWWRYWYIFVLIILIPIVIWFVRRSKK